MAEEPQNPAARVRNRASDWLRPIRAVSIAFDVRKVALAAIVLALIQAGWFSLDQVFTRSVDATDLFAGGPTLQGVASTGSPEVILSVASQKVAGPALVLTAPLWDFFNARADFTAAGPALLKFALAVVVFGIVGGAITRSAVLEAARGERLSLAQSLRFALKHSGALIAAPLLPMVAVLLCGLIAAGFGLLFQLPGKVGEVAGAIGFVVPLAMGLVAALLLIDLAVSWPLMHAAVAAEGEDSVDAMSRAFGCVNRRPAQFVGLVVLVWFVGSVGLVVVHLIATAGLHLAVWGAGFTAAGLNGPPAFWVAVVAFLVQSWAFAYFWSAAALIYLTLRRDIDGAAWSEVASGS